MKNRTGTCLEYLADAAAAAAFTAGFAGVFFYVEGILISGTVTVLLSWLICAAVILLSRRWWLVPLGLAGFGLPFWCWIWYQKQGASFILAVQNFMAWAFRRLFQGGPEPANETWPWILYLLIILIIALPVVAMVRRLNHLLYFLFLCLIIDVPFLIFYPSALNFVMPSLAGLMILLPAGMIRKIDRKQPGTHLPRSPLQLLAVPIVIISLWAGQMLTPADTLPWRQQDWINQLSDWSDFWQNQSGIGRTRQPFDLTLAGFPSVEKQLGGPVYLSDQVFLRVYADEPVLLRGMTRVIYTGRSWQSASQEAYRWTSALWQPVRQQIFTANLPDGSDGRAFLESFSREIQLRIVPQTVLQKTLFTVGTVNRITWNKQPISQPYFTLDGDLFVYDGVADGLEYSLTTRVFNRQNELFIQSIRPLEQSDKRNEDPYWQAVCGRYLELPGSLPAVVGETARFIIGDTADPYEQACLLQDFLKTEFTYSLLTDLPPVSMDFVAHFLQTKTGYCVHFATALAVMARTLGIPSRYVEGFSLAPGTSAGVYLATGHTAHAWTELYFRGIGWLTFDPTPSGEAEPDDDPNKPSGGPVEPTVTPSPAVTPLPGGYETNTDKDPFRTPLIILASLLIVLAFLAGLIILLYKRHIRQINPDCFRRYFLHAADCLDQGYQDLLLQLALLDLRPQTGETMQQFARRADGYLHYEDLHLPDVLQPVARWRYGGHEPSENEIRRLLELRLRLENRLRENMPRMAWYWRRVLMYWRAKNARTSKSPKN
ncbi:MAG: transglutaminase domain-containing protein [Clostridiaceae bacterium]|nr:transglutaminase domain-containing protein [Clostridiaceae bacterium]